MATKSGLSLFWRTFVLLALMLLGSVLAWTETLHELEAEPRAMQTGRQIASMVNLSRAAVMHTDSITQVSLFKTMKDQEHVVIVPAKHPLQGHWSRGHRATTRSEVTRRRVRP